LTVEQFELICKIAAEPKRSERCCLAYQLIQMLRGDKKSLPVDDGCVDLVPKKLRRT